MKTLIKNLKTFHYALIVLVLSLAAYMPLYHLPAGMFWDENYHIASAQKHIDHVMYMEPHPPLGKMLMAVGEVLLGFNGDTDQSKMLTTDYITGENIDPNMNFSGYRLPSTLMMALSVLFFFGILNRITRLPWLAAALSSFIIFDNALIMHSRAAMLEGIQLFFMLAALYYFVRCATEFTQNKVPLRLRHYAILGLLIGLTVMVKVNGLILLLLFVALFVIEFWPQIRQWHWSPIFKGAATRVPVSVASLAVVILTVFYVHIGMGTKVMEGRTYKASPEYLERIAQGKTWAPSTFIVGIKDNWKYMSEYADGVPRLDYCKDDENGSHAIGWPLSARAISYRWSKDTVDGQTVMYYSFLLGNPIIWFTVLIGILMSCALYIGRFVYHAPVKDQLLFNWIGVFTGFYLCYMLSILQIERVMYMYHYFIALIFGAINLALLITYLYRDEFLTLKKHTLINFGIFVALIIGAFAFFAPLTYSFGLTEDQFQLRNWFEFWHMRSAY